MSRQCTAAEVAGLLRPGMKVFIAGGTAQPGETLAYLAQHPQHCAGVHFYSVPLPGLNTCDPSGLHPEAEATAFFVTPHNRASVESGATRFIPMPYSQLFRHLGEDLEFDLLLLQIPEPVSDKASLGISVDFVPVVLHRAAAVVAEVNQQQPVPLDSETVSTSRLDYLLTCNRELPVLAGTAASADAQKIGAIVAELVEDGACLQLGIGEVPEAALAALRQKNDLSFHSGMISDGVMTLRQHGNISGAMVSGATLGSRDLIDWVAREPGLAVRPVSYTHDIGVLGNIPCFTSITSALEIDLLGQVNAEMVGGRRLSAPGGALDMMRGAARSAGGKSIVALPSTARNGAVSRIKAHLGEGSAVTAGSKDIDWVVTEWGARRIGSLDGPERARQLIQLAHPDFREELSEAFFTGQKK